MNLLNELQIEDIFPFLFSFQDTLIFQGLEQKSRVDFRYSSGRLALRYPAGELPNPVAEVISLLLKRQDEMEPQIKELGITSTVMKANGLLTRKTEMEEIFSGAEYK